MTKPPSHIAVIVGEVDADRQDDALRAALGLTLRGARVHVAITNAATPLGAQGLRARATLEMFNHTVTEGGAIGDALLAGTIEVWGPVRAALESPPTDLVDRRRIHLLRPGHAVPTRPRDALVLHLPDALHDDLADQLLDVVLASPTNPIVW